MESGIELIKTERKEQIEKHGFSLEKDREFYQKKELVQAAYYCLMLAEFGNHAGKNRFWPEGWDRYFEHKIINKNVIGKLTVAGAFLMAENEREGDTWYDTDIERIAKEIDRIHDVVNYSQC